ncbi:MAG: GvpL/GvpF family gas vesicle protein [Geobacter sp.]|nr:GvpL/GvpF family gas vesicle protein [Geobacter sp.]
MDNNYLYCIIGTGEARNFGPIGIGGRGDVVTTIHYENISAVISGTPTIKYDLNRENMLAHQKVVEEVMRDYTVLPVRFCTVSESVDDIRRVLRKRQAEFRNLLKEMDNKAEVGVKALWKDLKGVFQEIVENDPEIRRMKDKVALLPPDKGYTDRVNLGRMVQGALEARKKREAENILGRLAHISRKTVTNKLHGDSMVLNAAFLVEGRRTREFDEKMEELGTVCGERLTFKYVGPVPPFNFVNIVVEWK